MGHEFFVNDMLMFDSRLLLFIMTCYGLASIEWTQTCMRHWSRLGNSTLAIFLSICCINLHFTYLLTY